MSDQYWISPYQINTVSSKGDKNRAREKNICRRIICWSITKFFEVTSEELYARENTYEILEVKWLKVKADSSKGSSPQYLVLAFSQSILF